MKQLKTSLKMGNTRQIYELKCRILGTTHGEWSMTTYFHRLRDLWQELDHYQNLQVKCLADLLKFQKIMEEELT